VPFFSANDSHSGIIEVSLISMYGNTLQTSIGAICEPSGQFHALERNLSFDAETNTRIRLGRFSLSCRETYDDVSDVFVQYICNDKDTKTLISVNYLELDDGESFEGTESIVTLANLWILLNCYSKVLKIRGPGFSRISRGTSIKLLLM